MEKKPLEKLMMILISLSISLNIVSLLPLCEAIESPQYTVMHQESEFEIRLYRDSVWMSAPVNDLSFHKATRLGFHRFAGFIFEYSLVLFVGGGICLLSGDPPLRFVCGHLRFGSAIPPCSLCCIGTCKGVFMCLILLDWVPSSLFVASCLHQLFQYIQGANLNFSRIPMTKPVLTSIVPGSGPLHSSAYHVHFYLPVKFQDIPPSPLPELNLTPVFWPRHCIAVRKFSGFARDNNIVTEAEKLATSLGRSPWANSTSDDSKSAYSIAQYNSPFRIIGRVNEVWINIDGSESNNCRSSGLATY